MPTIQVVLDAELLKAADGAAERARINRSALIRNALRNHLDSLRAREREERDRAGYLASRENGVEVARWEAEAAWPGD
jgi:metal-responsive CopG/Arc/MetJ family transcriptional regulator